ncbi:MAG: alpha/beta hydrolase [Chloroflexota bacterium]
MKKRILPLLVMALLAVTLPACRLWQAASPTPFIPAPMAVSLNVPYAEAEGVDPNLLSLDIYSPAPASGCPVMVMIHGGGWRQGDKANEDVAALKSQHFAAQGYVFVSVNYRLSPEVMHPVHVQDVAASLAWVYHNIWSYGGDPERIFIMGHSAGAHLAALVATDEGYLEANGLDLSILKGVVLLDGAGYDIPYMMDNDSVILRSIYEGAFGTNPAAWEDASPVAHVETGKNIPPFLLFYAGNREDSRVNSQKLADLLTDAGVQNWVVSAPDKNHGTINGDIGKDGDWVTERIMEFLEEISP